MRFTIGPWVYLVRICPGPLHDDDGPVRAITHERIIHLSGKLRPGDRLEPLLDQLRRLHVRHYGPMAPEAVSTFTADVQKLRQLPEVLWPDSRHVCVFDSARVRKAHSELLGELLLRKRQPPPDACEFFS